MNGYRVTLEKLTPADLNTKRVTLEKRQKPVPDCWELWLSHNHLKDFSMFLAMRPAGAEAIR